MLGVSQLYVLRKFQIRMYIQSEKALFRMKS